MQRNVLFSPQQNIQKCVWWSGSAITRWRGYIAGFKGHGYWPPSEVKGMHAKEEGERRGGKRKRKETEVGNGKG